MKKINWLLESHVFGLLNPFIKEIKAQGHRLKIWSKPQYHRKQWSELFNDNECVVYYGSINLAKEIKEANKWVPGAQTNSDNWDCSQYYPVFGDLLFNKEYIMLPVGDLRRRKDELYDWVSSNKLFIKPNKGGKVFIGKCVTKNDFDSHLDLLKIKYEVPDDEICIVAKPQSVDKEWRFLIVDGKVVTGSQYREYGKDVQENVESSPSQGGIWNFAEYVTLSKDISKFDRAWTLDICESNGILHVLEIGGFSSAGLYKMDVAKIVSSVSRVALEDWNEVYSV